MLLYVKLINARRRMYMKQRRDMKLRNARWRTYVRRRRDVKLRNARRRTYVKQRKDVKLRNTRRRTYVKLRRDVKLRNAQQRGMKQRRDQQPYLDHSDSGEFDSFGGSGLDESGVRQVRHWTSVLQTWRSVLSGEHTCTHTLSLACIHIHIQVNIHVHVCTHTHIHVHVHVPTNAHTIWNDAVSTFVISLFY